MPVCPTLTLSLARAEPTPRRSARAASSRSFATRASACTAAPRGPPPATRPALSLSVRGRSPSLAGQPRADVAPDSHSSSEARHLRRSTCSASRTTDRPLGTRTLSPRSLVRCVAPVSPFPSLGRAVGGRVRTIHTLTLLVPQVSSIAISQPLDVIKVRPLAPAPPASRLTTSHVATDPHPEPELRVQGRRHDGRPRVDQARGLLGLLQGPHAQGSVRLPVLSAFYSWYSTADAASLQRRRPEAHLLVHPRAIPHPLVLQVRRATLDLHMLEKTDSS